MTRTQQTLRKPGLRQSDSNDNLYRAPATRRNGVRSRLEDVIIHSGVTVRSSGSRSGGGGGGTILIVGDEVVGHLGVELLGGLLGGAAVATAAGLIPSGLASSAGLGAIGCVSTVLDCGGRLWLSLGLADALTQRLGLGDKIRRGDDNLDLDWPVVDKKAVQLSERLAGSIGVVERNVRDSTADTAWTV